MSPEQQGWMAVGLLIAVVAIATLYFIAHTLSKRIDDLQRNMYCLFDDHRKYPDARFKTIEDRLERLEHPVVKGGRTIG